MSLSPFTLRACVALCAAALAGYHAGAWAQGAPAPTAAPAPAAGKAADTDALLRGAELIGAGRLRAYRVGASVIVAIPASDLGKPFLWYTEVVGIPAGAVANDGLEVQNAMSRFERIGDAVHVRDLSSVIKRRSAPRPEERMPTDGPPNPGAVRNDARPRAIDVALGSMETGPLVASFPIKATQPDGTLLVDVTAVFSSDIPVATGRLFAGRSGLVPLAVDPTKSYIERVRVRGESLNIRTHLTFLGNIPVLPIVGPQPMSLVLGHSLVFLPDKPMAPRLADPRVGFFTTDFTQFETAGGPVQQQQQYITRFRLEKANPRAAVSDPIKPITFYLGPGIPQRWKPYIAAGVRQWLPVFEAAGFSNAIRVLDAPTPQEDPNWSVEDVTTSVIRWLPEDRANAMGPHVVDPRSGETISAHIQIWPKVLDFFGLYYWALFGGGVDPEATRLPLSTEKAGALLAYVVAHEVGHTLGLAHNQVASTAHTVQQLRTPEFANRHGPNSSIMAYGRFNQAAQPGDGITQLWGVAGPYDYAAIRYGYGVFGTDAASERKALAEFADSFAKDRRLYWGSEEGGNLIDRFGRDPRSQMENVGVERVEATRLGLANTLRSLQRLDAATQGDAGLYASAFDTVLGRHVGMLKSVNRLIGGTLAPLGSSDGPLARYVPAQEQRQAVNFLLGEGAASLQPFAAPAVLERVSVFGGYRSIDRLQASLVPDLLNGPNVALLESQKRRDPAAYSSLDLGRDVAAAVWSDLKAATSTQRALQRGYIEAAQRLLDNWSKGGEATEVAAAQALQASQQVGPAAARLLVETGDDTVFIPWLQASLPPLKDRLGTASRSAADESDRLHFAGMATQVARLIKLGAP